MSTFNMPSVRYYNATAPFWDFVANMEQEQHNRSQATDNNENNNNNNNNNERPNPWASAEGWAGFPWGPFPHRGRGRHGPRPHHHHEGPPPPSEGDSSDPEAGPASDPRGPPLVGRGPPPFAESGDEGHEHRRGHHGCGRGGFGARGGHGRGRGGPRGFHAGGPGRRSHHFHPYAMGPFGAFAEMFQNQLFGGEEKENNNKNEDFKPEADVFDTPEAFVVHVSLPGAKKEDVGVNWDAEKSEISIAGVVYRPGNEELLKTLAVDERKVGAFERKVRLGSRANPAQVDVEGITARMEDGVLTVEVPKLDVGYVEIKKVDIE